MLSFVYDFLDTHTSISRAVCEQLQDKATKECITIEKTHMINYNEYNNGIKYQTMVILNDKPQKPKYFHSQMYGDYI
jgi:hypothetical protein